MRHLTYFTMVFEEWAAETGFVGMMNLQLKLSRVKNKLCDLNWSEFEDVFESFRHANAAVETVQIAYDSSPSGVTRTTLHRCTTVYVLLTRMEEDFWKQNAAIRWVAEGEHNTNLF